MKPFSPHCDNCGRASEMSQIELGRSNWYTSSRKAPSGIPWTVFCPECKNLSSEPPKPMNNEALKKLENKLVKHYFVECMNPTTHEIDYSLIDDSNDFSVIPKNSKGEVRLQVGELRDIVAECVRKATEEEKNRIRGLVPEEMEGCICGIKEGCYDQCSGGFNQCRELILKGIDDE